MFGPLTGLPENGEPPTEFCIFPFGTFATSDGDYTFTRTDGLNIIAQWQERGTQPVIEYEHASTRRPGEPSPAAGWFTLELRPNGLWARDVRWTERAAEFIRAREYRYTSPTFPHSNGQALGFFNVSLTNTPATYDQRPLVAASTRIEMEQDLTPEQKSAFFKMAEEWLKSLAKPADAPAEGDVSALAEEPIMDEAGEVEAVEAAEDEAVEGDDAKIAAAAREACGLAADASMDEVLGALKALAESKKALGDSEQSVATLSARIGVLEGTIESTKRDALIERAQKAGKLSGSLVSWAKGQSVATLSSFIDAAPGRMDRMTQVKVEPAPTAAAAVNDEAKARVAALFGK